MEQIIMSAFLMEEYYFKLKLIGIYQIIGGCIGLGITIWFISMVWPLSLIVSLILILSVSFFLFSIACGLGLAFKKSWAIDLSIILQLAQIVNFTLFGYSFKFISGLGVLLTIDFTKSLKINLEGSEPLFSFIYLNEPDERLIGINLTAILLTYFIIDLKKKISRLLDNSALTNIETSAVYPPKN